MVPRSIDDSGAPLTDTTPSTICRSFSSTSSASAAILSTFSFARLAARWIAQPLLTAPLLLRPFARQVDRRAAHPRGARGEGADGVRHPAGVAGDHLDVLEPD